MYAIFFFAPNFSNSIVDSRSVNRWRKRISTRSSGEFNCKSTKCADNCWCKSWRRSDIKWLILTYDDTSYLFVLVIGSFLEPNANITDVIASFNRTTFDLVLNALDESSGIEMKPIVHRLLDIVYREDYSPPLLDDESSNVDWMKAINEVGDWYLIYNIHFSICFVCWKQCFLLIISKCSHSAC